MRLSDYFLVSFVYLIALAIIGLASYLVFPTIYVQGLISLIAIALTGFATYFASYLSNKRNYQEQLNEKRKNLSLTVKNDIISLFKLYERVVRKNLLQNNISENQVPIIILVEPRQNYFALFDNKINELEIIDNTIQQKIIYLYGRMKALYDECLEYSNKLKYYAEFTEKFGYTLFRLPGHLIKELSEEEINRALTGNINARMDLNYYKLTSSKLFGNIKSFYLFLKEEDKEIYFLYGELKEDLEKYINTLK